MPKFNAIRQLLGMPEMDEQREQQIEQYKQEPDQMQRDARLAAIDRLRMGNPEMQGPRLGMMTPTPAEEAQAGAIAEGMGGTVGSLGSGITKKQAIARAEDMVKARPTVNYTQEKFNQAQQFLRDNILNNPNTSQETKAKALRMFQNYEKKAVTRGVKPE